MWHQNEFMLVEIRADRRNLDIVLGVVASKCWNWNIVSHFLDAFSGRTNRTLDLWSRGCLTILGSNSADEVKAKGVFTSTS